MMKTKRSEKTELNRSAQRRRGEECSDLTTDRDFSFAFAFAFDLMIAPRLCALLLKLPFQASFLAREHALNTSQSTRISRFVQHRT